MTHHEAITAVVTAGRGVQAGIERLRAITKDHNDCFTVSDDETCDRGWGDCRPIVQRVYDVLHVLEKTHAELRALEPLISENATAAFPRDDQRTGDETL